MPSNTGFSAPSPKSRSQNKNSIHSKTCKPNTSRHLRRGSRDQEPSEIGRWAVSSDTIRLKILRKAGCQLLRAGWDSRSKGVRKGLWRFRVTPRGGRKSVLSRRLRIGFSRSSLKKCKKSRINLFYDIFFLFSIFIDWISSIFISFLFYILLT